MHGRTRVIYHIAVCTTYTHMVGATLNIDIRVASALRSYPYICSVCAQYMSESYHVITIGYLIDF